MGTLSLFSDQSKQDMAPFQTPEPENHVFVWQVNAFSIDLVVFCLSRQNKYPLPFSIRINFMRIS